MKLFSCNGLAALWRVPPQPFFWLEKQQAPRARGDIDLDTSTKMPIDLLNDDELAKCFSDLPAMALVACSAVSTQWQQLVQLAVEKKLAELAPRPAQEDFNQFLQLVTLERLEDAIGSRPDHSWQDEWTEFMVMSMREQCRLGRDFFEGLEWNQELDAVYRLAFDRESLNEKSEVESSQEIALGVGSGMPFSQSQAFVLLGTNGEEVLFAPHLALAASSYAYYDALSTMARLAAAAAISPPVYCGLDGQYGLTEVDLSWDVLSKMQVGERFVTHRFQSFTVAGESCFPEGKTDGIYMTDVEEAITSISILSSNVVCIRSAKNDRSGRHNLIRDVTTKRTRAEPGFFSLPPYAVVTLLSVQDKWRVRRQQMCCRLFTCEVSFDLR